MEYLGRGFRYLNQISEYDLMAISYGYVGKKPEHLNWFCTDEDKAGSGKGGEGNSAECSSDDATADPFGFFESRLASAVDKLVARGSAEAPEWTVADMEGPLGIAWLIVAAAYAVPVAYIANDRILEVSLKVLPLPAAETTLRFEKTAAEAVALVNQWAGQPLPVSATAWVGGDLSARLSGAAAAVDAAAKKLGGERIAPEPATRFWHGIREHTDPYFKTGRSLWRLSLKSTTPPLNLPGAQLIEWGGALRWLATDADARTVRAAAALGGGHATWFRCSDKSSGVFQPLPPALMTIHRNLKRTFDPAGILNPGRMYDWM
jgi:FAD/FMN-containing dehydrogenase